jgi:PAS domain-containing protein
MEQDQGCAGVSTDNGDPGASAARRRTTQLGGSPEHAPEGLLTRRAQAGRRRERLRVALAAARNALEHSESGRRPARAAQATIWDWHLASGRVEWSDTLKDLFGYAERVTDAAWREDRIHPEDRDRVKVSLQRATMVNHGAAWTEQHRFRQADGCYATVTERAYIVQDDTGPCRVLGRITPASAGRLYAGSAEPPPPRTHCLIRGAQETYHSGRDVEVDPGLVRAEGWAASS